MASGTAADGGSLNLDCIPILDLRLLSQSELYSLSLCSSTAFDPRRCDDVVIPKIDRSVFNESAGSRKQTYSRLRLAPPSSSSAGPRRRTPHLRPIATTFTSIKNHNSDPENAENSHIVALLKQVFVADLNPGDLVPVKIDYSDSLPAQQFSSLPSSTPSSVCPSGHKRKRGRPRRDEMLGDEGDLAMGVNVDDVTDNVDGFSSLNEIFVHENMEDRDRAVLNRDGVAVDLVALGVVEHPYREEIWRRTQGLATEEELLGFLKGLNGQWGSRRKKKKIVDATEFGAALPIGWKLSLSVKKKNGHVWLYCRRYISPSGLHFVSCKGVSSYLLSLHGVRDTNLPLPYSAQHNEIVNYADKLTSVTAADLAVKDGGRKENPVSHASLSPAFGSTSSNHEIQVIKDAGDFPEHGVKEILHWNKCNTTFSGKDELLQPLSSCPQRNRYKNGMRITDGVIIKDGKYECQFCHKAFSERHRYNGHVGTHVRYQAKIAGESLVGNVKMPVDTSSFGKFPSQDTVPQGSLGSDNVMESCNAATNNGENICSLGNKDSENVGVLKGDNGGMRAVGEAADIVTETNPCAVDVLFLNNNNRSFHEDAYKEDGATETINDTLSLRGRRSENCSPSYFDDATHGVKNVGVVENSSGTWQPEQRMVSKSSLLDSNKHVKECDGVVNDECISQTRNEVKLDFENLKVNGSMVDFFGTHEDQDKDIAVSVKQQNNFNYLPCKDVGVSVNTSTSGSIVSKLNKLPKISMLPTSQDEKACAKDDVPCSIGKHKVDETCSFGTCEKGNYQAANDAVCRHEEMQFGISSDLPSYNEQEELKKFDTALPAFVLKEPGIQRSCKSSLVALSGHESMYGSSNNDEEVCGRKIEVPEYEYFQNFGNGESSDPFSSSHVALNLNSIQRNEQHRKLGICSGITTAIDKQFFVEDNAIQVSSGALEEHRQEPPESVLLGLSGVPEVSDEAATLNKIYNKPSNHSKLNIIDNTGKHELSLSFGNLQTELCTDSSRVEQERHHTDSFNIQSVAQNLFGDQTHLNTVNDNISGDLKHGRPVGSDILNSSFNIRTHEPACNFDAARPGDKIGTSGQNFLVGFGNSGSESGDCGTADNSWRTGHENVFQGCFDAAASLQVPSSDCLGTFGPTLDKGSDGLFGVNKDYDIQTDILRPGRSEPVEYRFLGEESSNTMPGESKISSYTANMEQGLDPSFWLGKDALMPNAAHSNQITSVCVWCRNLFLHESDQLGTQLGAIGTMCPSCSSRIPGQFNLL